MTALTIDIDDRLIEALRDAAARRHTTVDAIVGECVEPSSNSSGDEAWLIEARETMRDLMATSTARLNPDYKWHREQLYADRLLPRHEHPGLRGDGEAG